MNVRRMFDELRFDRNHHMGLGDICLTIAQQDEVVAEVERIAARLAEAERKLKNYEPINLYDGLTIDQWKARCDEAEALLVEARGYVSLCAGGGVSNTDKVFEEESADLYRRMVRHAGSSTASQPEDAVK